MKIIAELNRLRISPRKVRLAADAIRGRSVPEAERLLRFLTRRAAHPLAKLLRSAEANARQNFRVTSPDDLVVAEVRVDGGPTLKRSQPRAFGRAFPIRKRTSHVSLTLETKGSVPVRRRKQGRAVYAVVEQEASGDQSAEEATRKPSITREAFRVKAKIERRPAGFVRRVFRRKAI